MSELEDIFLLHVKLCGLPEPQREYHFARDVVGDGRGLRKRLADAELKDWRFDFAWPDRKLAVEIEGGTWSGGRHVRGSGFEDDCRKYNAAVRFGWRVLRYTSDMLDGEAWRDVERMIGGAL